MPQQACPWFSRWRPNMGPHCPSVEGDAAIVGTGDAKARQPPWPEQEWRVRPGLKVRWRWGWLRLPLHVAALL